MKCFSARFETVVLWLFVGHVVRKNWQYSRALQFIQQHQAEVSVQTFAQDDRLNNYIQDWKKEKKKVEEGKLSPEEVFAPAVLLLNRHALSLTHNWLCNVRHMGHVHQTLLIFAFDSYSADSLRTNWPHLTVLDWPIEALQGKFKTGDGPYQMFQLFRSNLASHLANEKVDFWMIQSDTYWRGNLFDRADPELFLNSSQSILFDREGDHGLLSHMVAGGNFFVRGNEQTAAFFGLLGDTLKWLYTTDNNLMGAFCTNNVANVACAFIPYRTLSNWRWHYTAKRTLPSLLQFDGGTGSQSKLEKIQSLGGRFAMFDEDGKVRCDEQKTRRPATAIAADDLRTANEPSVLQSSLRFFQGCCEFLFSLAPSFFRQLFLATIFPFYAYFFVAI